MKISMMFWFWVFLTTVLCAPKFGIIDDFDINDADKTVISLDGFGKHIWGNYYKAKVQNNFLSDLSGINIADLNKRVASEKQIKRTRSKQNKIIRKQTKEDGTLNDAFFRNGHLDKVPDEPGTPFNDGIDLRSDGHADKVRTMRSVDKVARKRNKKDMHVKEPFLENGYFGNNPEAEEHTTVPKDDTVHTDQGETTKDQIDRDNIEKEEEADGFPGGQTDKLITIRHEMIDTGTVEKEEEEEEEEEADDFPGGQTDKLITIRHEIDTGTVEKEEEEADDFPDGIPSHLRDLLGVEVVDYISGGNQRPETGHPSHKYTPSSSSSLKLTSFDKQSLLSLVQTIFTHSERKNTKRTNYDDGKAPVQQSTGSSEGNQPLYHRYTSSNTLTLTDMYIKRGGVCTLIEGFSPRPIYVISACPPYGSATNIRFYCERASPYNKRFHQENIIDLIMTPVQDSTGFVYKNVYCAQCNGVTSIIAWNTKLDCDHFQSVELSDGRQQIRILDQFADKHQGCQRQLRPEIGQMLHECSLKDVISTMKSRTHDLRIGEGSKSELSPFPLSYSILMNFGFDGKTHILFTTQASEYTAYGSQCNDDEIYDQYNDKCRAISCDDGYEFSKGACQKTEHYESDSTPGDLIDLEEIEEPLRVTLTIRNVSILDLTMLYLLDLDGNLENMCQDIFSTSFNISKERIQNVSITLFNTSDAASQLSQEEIDIFIMATTQRLFSTSSRPTMATDLHKILTVLDGPEEVLDGDTENDPADDPGEVIDTLKLKTNNSDDDGNTTNTILTTTIPPYFDSTINSNMSVNISFILYHPHRNRTHLEKSTKSVVKSMSDLVESKLFILTINGTNFPIVGIYNVEDVQSMDKFCELGHVTDYYSMGEEFVVEMVYIPEIGVNVTTIYVNETGKEYSPGQYDLTYSFNGVMGMLNKTIVESFVLVCDMPDILDEQCSRIVLTSDEYELVSDEDDLSPPVIKFAHHKYNMSQFEWHSIGERTIRICAPEWNNSFVSEASRWGFVCGDDLFKLVIAESYLTFILGLISLVCLLSVLITYGMFEKLRNLPGINTMNLTMSMFMGELVFMLSGWMQPHRWLCSTVGVVLHFLFLASFFWMNIMSYDVFCTFAAKTNILGRIRSKKKYVIRYSAYAWGCPFIIVGICSVIDFTNMFENIAIGYGGIFAGDPNTDPSLTSWGNESLSEANNIYSIGCWIQQPVASMVAFGGPMILILFSNTIMFIRTIICIRANTKSTKDSIRRSSVRKNVGHDDVMLYVKMSTVMGFTWIFGLASSVVSAFSGTPTRISCIILHLLGILFIVFNCSQGIFIFFVFVVNRRVLALYKGLYVRHTQDKKRPVSISTSSGTVHSTFSQCSLNTVT